jgi:hypothetical protein
MAEVLELGQCTHRPDLDLGGSGDGVRVLGRFRDRDDEDRVVWLRAFADLAARDAFHGDQAPGADVLLLRPSAPVDPSALDAGLVTITLYHLPPGDEDAFVDFFTTAVHPLLTGTGARPLAVLRTLPEGRPDAGVVAWVASFADPEELREHVRTLGREPRWTHEVLPALTSRLARPPEQLQLAPVASSPPVR